MEWAKLVVDLLSSLAWPLAVIVILLTFRRPITARIYDVQKAKLPGGIEVELLQHLDRAKEKVVKGKRKEAAAELEELVPFIEQLLQMLQIESDNLQAADAEIRELRARVSEQAGELAVTRRQMMELRELASETLVERAGQAGYEAGLRADIGDPADSGE